MEFVSIASWEAVCSETTRIRTVHILTVPFIAEDVLGDLGVRQAIRNIPKNVRL